jgi:hypothetical protein
LAVAGSWVVFLLLIVAAPAATLLLSISGDNNGSGSDDQVHLSLTLTATLAYVSFVCSSTTLVACTRASLLLTAGAHRKIEV